MKKRNAFIEHPFEYWSSNSDREFEVVLVAKEAGNFNSFSKLWHNGAAGNPNYLS